MTATDNIDCVFLFTFCVLFKFVILMSPKKPQPFLFFHSLFHTFLPFICCLLWSIFIQFWSLFSSTKSLTIYTGCFLFSYCLTVFLSKRKNLAEFAGILLRKCSVFLFFYIGKIFSYSDLFFKLYFQNRMIGKINFFFKFNQEYKQINQA